VRRSAEPARISAGHAQRRGRSSRRVRLDRRAWLRLALLTSPLLLAVVFLRLLPGAGEPLDVTYEIDLGSVAEGELAVTLVISGDLPRKLALAFPPGVFDRKGSSVQPVEVAARALGADGRPGERLFVTPTENGWLVDGIRGSRAGFTYRLALGTVSRGEADIRRHISGRTAGGLRAAAFEILVQPVDVRLGDLGVSFRNPEQLPLVVPWSGGLAASAEAVPENVLYRPRDRGDLNNALIACGRDLRVWTVDLAEVRLRVATDHDWYFADDDLTTLLRRIAATEIDFFGEAPQALITCLVAPNRIAASGGFDIYGAHTGSSLILWLDPQTTYAALRERAASVVAHEMFHGWLGEAIRQREPDTLWFTEGATSLYAVRLLVTAGIWSPDHAQTQLATRLERDLYGNPRHGEVAIADAAAMVMADAETIRLGYAGGMAACLGLERWLVAGGAPAEPLDALLRHLYAHRDESPLTRQSLEAAITATTGLDAAAWLARHVYGTETLPAVAPVL